MPQDPSFRILEDAFDEAVDLPEAGQQAVIARLRQEQEHEHLAVQLEQLLAASSSDHAGKLEGPQFDPELMPEQQQAGARAGVQMGPFVLEELLGHGGMGEVYRGRRKDEFEQTVAVKLLRNASAQGIFARRFVRERHALARLNHPHIAGLIDGGVTDDGAPWLAMEFVDGTDLLSYCRSHQLSTRKVVRLMVQVADAVQFAHQQLIVHRDLKPGNIMVRSDGHPVLLDFGIAKLIEPTDEGDGGEQGKAFADGLGNEALTLPQAPICTPEYASPEQMRGENVGTGSDVYSLGVILFQALSGELPFATDGRTQFELTKVVSEKTAPLLSEKLPQVSKDLAAIVGQCLRKEPEHRYLTVQALLDDLLRWLKGMPVHAQPATLWYRGKRFVQRHRVAVTLALLLIGVSVAGFSAWLEQSKVAARKGLTASRVSEFLVEFFNQPDPWGQGTSAMTMDRFFGEHLDSLFESLQDEPEVEAELAAALGLVLRNLGDSEKAIPLLMRSAMLLKQIQSSDLNQRAEINFELGVAYYRAGNLEQAQSWVSEALRLHRREHGERSEPVASCWNTLGLIAHLGDDLDLAEELYTKALELREQIHGGVGLPLASTLNNLGGLALWQEETDDAIVLFERAKWIHGKAYQVLGHPDLATTLNNLGAAYEQKGDLDQAEAYFNQSLAMRRELLPAHHPHLAGSLTNLGLIEESRGNNQGAIELFQQALDLARVKAPADHPLLLDLQAKLDALMD
jgi:eukaryotic-like serine/threonine-protein kinase